MFTRFLSTKTNSLILAGLQFVTLQNQAVEVGTFYTFTNSNMQNLTTGDLGTLENSFSFLEDLPTGKIWNVELNDNGDLDNFFYRDERNAKARFDALVKQYGLKVKNEHDANDGFGTSVWMGEIYFND